MSSRGFENAFVVLNKIRVLREGQGAAQKRQVRAEENKTE